MGGAPDQHRSILIAVALAAAAMLLALLPACDRRAGGDRITLELWTLALDPFEGYILGLIEGFEAQHPGVEVVWVDVPYTALDRKLIAAAAAGRAPDVVNFSDMTFARFASLGATADLTPHLAFDPEEVYLPDVLSIGRINDQLLALPWYLTTQSLIINEPLLASMGLAPDDLPTSIEGLRETARGAHARTGRFLFSLPMGEESNLLWMMLAAGVVPFEENADGRLVAAVDSPEVRAFLEPWMALYADGALPREAATTGHAHLIDLYKSRRIACMNAAPNFMKRIRDEAPSVFAESVIRPPATEVLGRAHVAVMLVSVTTQSEHPELAAALAAHITSPAAQLEFCRIVDILPSTSATLDDPFFNPDLPADPSEGDLLLRARAISADSLRSAVAFTPALETWPDLRRSFEDRIKRVMLDGEPLEEALAAIQRDWSQILAAAAPASLSAVPRPEPLAPKRAASATVPTP